jgi:hypothetical protein
MSIHNKRGIFWNAEDTIEDLQAVLKERFTRVKVETRAP